MRIAILLRGIHYQVEHRTDSSFTRRHDNKTYTVDYERHFYKTFYKFFIKANKFNKIDFFISSYKSPKSIKLTKQFKPVKYIFFNTTKDSNQVNTFVEGLNLIKEHITQTKTKYDYIFCTRMDLKYSGNVFPILEGNKQQVTVTRHLGYTDNNFCDFIHLIDPLILNLYIKHMSGKDGNKLMQCITDPIYQYIRFKKRQNNWIVIDREFVCSQYVNSSKMITQA